jgi:hypothetical protein
MPRWEESLDRQVLAIKPLDGQPGDSFSEIQSGVIAAFTIPRLFTIRRGALILVLHVPSHCRFFPTRVCSGWADAYAPEGRNQS